jgi:tetratricopeptide (TPR) repeat protein
MTEAEVLHEAERLLNRGEILPAERVLATLWADTTHAPAIALHLLGQIRKAQGRVADAERYLRRAIAAEPDVADRHAALGDLLAGAGLNADAASLFASAGMLAPHNEGIHRRRVRALIDAGMPEEAESVARVFLTATPSAEAWIILANALRARDKFEEALAASEAAATLQPASVGAVHGRGVALARLGRNQEALDAFDDLVRRGVRDPALYTHRGAALMRLARADEAESTFEQGVRQWPVDQHLQHALATTRWMRGAGQSFARSFEAAVAQNPDAVALRIGCADLLRRADLRQHAEDMLREGLRRSPDHPALAHALGVLLDEMDRSQEAVALLDAGLAAQPNSLQVRGAYVNALLRLGRGDEALVAIQPARLAEPVNQEWICYESMALRQLGDARYHELCDYDLMVQPFELPPPQGYRSTAEFNAALREQLMRLHVLDTHPLDQSLRHGSQTTRSLLHVDDPVVKQYLAALHEPIQAYMELMRDPDHIWSGRKTGGYRLAGCWSVKLKPSGYHINHYHPAGWISSAYYVSVPEVTSAGDSQEGWIKFGEARWPTPSCTVERVVQPKAGTLVLFPSYMWHGTIPFSAGERITAPFDAVPA